MSKTSSASPNCLLRFLRDRKGVAAIEFAMTAPLLLVLYMGGTEVTLAVMLNRKVHHAVSVVTDLTTQRTVWTKAELDGIFNVAGEILQPYDRDDLKMRVDAIQIDAAGKGKIAWSYARNMTAIPKNVAVTVPAAYAGLRSAFLVSSQVNYQYIPMGGYGMKNPIDMGETAIFKPRTGTEVKCTDCP
jgi:Flp pilus assembly protein TadG